ncbi:GTP-binding protein Era [Candidatus Phytoplasma oryzae]|uniref:GTPase Era n=1 Tax=Candidatus Phytoplasma oryzae TaxID=203274 RepID=A0A139JQU0_9MOLU|nr:GTPase Era [Candidatus Phytoplasma oryzae]KXT29329.1 GTP-binding protein Era [Candidatus Phytoplasma oryzae]
MFKSGFISIIGEVNVGKSTLLNNILEKKVSITSIKSGTTIRQIMGIYNQKKYQLVFIDNPGIIFFKKKIIFPKQQNSLSLNYIQELDIILFMVDREYKPEDQVVLNILKKYNKKIFLLINKIDSFRKKIFIDKIIISFLKNFYFDEIIPLSCHLKQNFHILIQKILLYLKEKPPYFSQNILTNLTQEELISDFVREKILCYINQEIPHYCNVLVDNINFNKCLNLTDISVLVLVKKNSQKKIIIGTKGQKIKKIRIQSQKNISKIFQTKVSLNLWVKVEKKIFL